MRHVCKAIAGACAILCFFLSVMPSAAQETAASAGPGGMELSIPHAFGPAWSHGGHRLALFVHGQTFSTLSVYDLATGQTTPLREMRFASGLTPLWMPGDDAVLTQDFTTLTEAERGREYSDPNFLLVDVASGESTQVTSAEDMTLRHAAVSPNGALIAFAGPKLGTPFTIASVRVGRNEKGERVETPIQVPYTGLWLLSLDDGELTLVFPDEDAMESNPQFSPDGNHILFSRSTDFSSSANRRLAKRNVAAYERLSQN